MMQIGGDVGTVNPGDSVRRDQPGRSVETERKKKVDTVPLLLVVLGMYIAFFAIWWGGTVTRGGMAGLGVQRYEALAYVLIFLGSYLAFFSSRGGKIWRQSRYRGWLGLYSGLVVLMVLRSLIAGTSLLYLLQDTMPFLLIAALFIGQNKAYWQTLNSTFVFHTALGVIYGVIVLMNVLGAGTAASFSRSFIWTQTDVKLVSNMLYAVPLLVVSYPTQSRLGKTVAMLGLAILLVVGVLSQGRSTIVKVVLTLLLAGYTGFRTKLFLKTHRKVLLALAVLIAIGGLLLGAGSLGKPGISTSWKHLLYRFTGSQGFIQQTMGDARLYEARLVASMMSWDEWLLGRGVSARWSSPNMYGGKTRSMVHLGYLHLVFVGGVGLALLFVFFPLAVGWRSLLTSRDVGTLAAVAVVVMYSVDLLYGGAPQAGLWFVLIFLCAGKLAAAAREDS